MQNKPQIRVYSSRTAAVQAFGAAFARAAERAITARERFNVVLGGGNTPRDAYRLIANEHVNEIDWVKTHVFWGDERMVSPNDPESNARMARETLLNHVPIPANNIHRIAGEKDPQQAADEYHTEIERHFRGAAPRFDLVILGIGADGHTASLFPGTAGLQETTRYAVANHVPQLDTWRVTLTLPVINSASLVIMYVLGEDKAPMIQHILGGGEGETVPAQLVKPVGELMWIMDAAAGALLKA